MAPGRAHDRRDRIGDLIGSRPLTARSVLASTLLGADQPRLSVSELVAAASLFGITAGAARTCLWRMVSTGELTSDDGTYALAGHLLERRHRVLNAAEPGDATARRWDGTWELAIVSLDRRPAADRLKLRAAASALHLAELKEGVWIRPDNLDPDRLPASRAVLDRQCVHFRGAESEVGVDSVTELFALDSWSRDAERLIAAIEAELDAKPPAERAEMMSTLTYQFALAIAVVRHLQLDPLLPRELLPRDWPGTALRRRYRRLYDAFKRHMNEAFRTGSDSNV